MSTTTTYNISGTTSLPFADAVARVRETLGEEGFGVLTEIDVQATLREKIGKEISAVPDPGRVQPSLCAASARARDGAWDAPAVQRCRL